MNEVVAGCTCTQRRILSLILSALLHLLHLRNQSLNGPISLSYLLPLPSSQSLTRKTSSSISNPYLRFHTIKTPPIILSSPLLSPLPPSFPVTPAYPTTSPSSSCPFSSHPLLFPPHPLLAQSSLPSPIPSHPPPISSPPLLSCSHLTLSSLPSPLRHFLPFSSPFSLSTLLPSYHPLSPSLPNYPYMPHNPPSPPYKPLLTRKASPIPSRLLPPPPPSPLTQTSFPTKTLPYSTQPPAHSKSINLTIQHTHHPSRPSPPLSPPRQSLN